MNRNIRNRNIRMDNDKGSVTYGFICDTYFVRELPDVAFGLSLGFVIVTAGTFLNLLSGCSVLRSSPRNCATFNGCVHKSIGRRQVGFSRQLKMCRLSWEPSPLAGYVYNL